MVKRFISPVPWSQCAFFEKRRAVHAILAAYQSAMQKVIENQPQLSYDKRTRLNLRLSSDKSSVYSAKKKPRKLSPEELSEKKLARMMLYPRRHTWKEFLSMSEKTSLPYVLHVLWKHKQHYLREVPKVKPLPDFPHSFCFLALCWVIRTMTQIKNTSEFNAVAHRYQYDAIVLIRKVGYALSRGDPNEMLVYSFSEPLELSVNSLTRWEVSLQYVDYLVNAYRETQLRNSEQTTELQAAHKEWNVVLSRALDILIPAVLANWGKSLLPSTSRPGGSFPWAAVLKLYSYATTYTFSLLWDPSGSSKADSHPEVISQASPPPPSHNFVEFGIQSVLPYCAIIHALISKYRHEYKIDYTRENAESLSQSIADFFRSLATQCPKRRPYSGTDESEPSCVIFNEFLLLSMENALKDVPTGWLVYARILEAVFHTSRVMLDEDDLNIEKNKARRILDKSIKFCQNEHTYLIHGSSIPQDYFDPRTTDKETPNVLLFPDAQMAKSYQHALATVLDAAIAHVSWHGYHELRINQKTGSNHWQIACRLMKSVQERMNRVSFSSEWLTRVQRADGFFAFTLLPPASRRWTLQNVFKLFTATEKFDLSDKVFWKHIEIQRKAAIRAYLEMLTGEIKNQPSNDTYRLLLSTQIQNILRIPNMSIELLSCSISPDEVATDQWTAISPLDPSVSIFPHFTQGTFLMTSSENLTEFNDVDVGSRFRNVRLVTHSFPLYYFLHILLQRKRFPKTIHYAIKTHGKALTLDEVLSALRLMKDSHWCWRDALWIYTYSIQPKMSAASEVTFTYAKLLYDVHMELSAIFMIDRKCFYHDESIEDTSKRLLLFFSIFRQFVHHIAFAVRQKSRQIDQFNDVNTDEALLTEILTQRSAKIVMRITIQLIRTYFNTFLKSISEGSAVLNIMQYSQKFDQSVTLTEAPLIARPPVLNENTTFVQFFLQYAGMVMKQCIKFLYLDLKVKE